jgi:hypothetical protein
VNLGNVDYGSTKPPEGYRCTTCGAHGCKLWREYNTCADYTELVCCDCAGKSLGKDVSDIDADGMRPLTRDYSWAREDERTDQIGWRVPAVPTAEGDTFWGYLIVPADGASWWRRLPTMVSP